MSETVKVNAVKEGQERQQFLLQLHKEMWFNPSSGDYDFVNRDWIRKGLFDAETEDKVDILKHQYLACKHGKLDPNKVLQTKIVQKSAADKLYERYRHEGPRFSGIDAMCQDCVQDYCRKIQTKNQIENFKKTIRDAMNNFKPDGVSGFWVGKKSFAQWSGMANQLLLGAEMAPAEAEVDEAPALQDSVSASTVAPTKPKAPPKILKEFNEDLRCEHGDMEPDKKERRVVPRVVWEVFLTYWPETEPFPEDRNPCPVCSRALTDEQEAAIRVKKVAADLRRNLADFLGDNKGQKPNLSLLHDQLAKQEDGSRGPTLYIITRHLLTQIQKFLKTPATDNQPVSMSGVLLLCTHGKMMYNLQGQTILDSSCDLVFEHQFDAIRAHINEDVRVTIYFEKVNGRVLLRYEPELCLECAQMKLEEKIRQLFEFESAKIRIRKLGDRDTECKVAEDDDAVRLAQLTNGSAYENDPEFQPGLFVPSTSAPIVNGAKKRAGGSDCNGEVVEKKHCLEINGHATLNGHASELNEIDDFSKMLSNLGLPSSFGPGCGLSSAPRIRKKRNDRDIDVASCDTLKDLKKKIYKEFQIPFSDQHLFFDETKVKLDGDDRTLGDLGVSPNCLILVRGDKPNGVISVLASKDSHEEERGQMGFQGTKLLNGD